MGLKTSPEYDDRLNFINTLIELTVQACLPPDVMRLWVYLSLASNLTLDVRLGRRGAVVSEVLQDGRVPGETQQHLGDHGFRS